MQNINREKIIRNITRLLERASDKNLRLLFQVAYEIVKKA